MSLSVQSLIRSPRQGTSWSIHATSITPPSMIHDEYLVGLMKGFSSLTSGRDGLP